MMKNLKTNSSALKKVLGRLFNEQKMEKNDPLSKSNKKLDNWFKKLDYSFKLRVYKLLEPLIQYSMCAHEWEDSGDVDETGDIICRHCKLRCSGDRMLF